MPVIIVRTTPGRGGRAWLHQAAVAQRPAHVLHEGIHGEVVVRVDEGPEAVAAVEAGEATGDKTRVGYDTRTPTWGHLSNGAKVANNSSTNAG